MSDGPPSTMAAWRSKWWLLLAVLLVVAVGDQCTKHWASTSLRRQHAGSLVLQRTGITRAALTYVRNPGAAWGFLASQPESFRRPFFIGVSVVAMVFLLLLFLRLQPGQWLVAAALAAILAGALGNLLDRIRFGHVIDFIDLQVGRFRWPTFNVADVAITFGVALVFGEMVVATIREWRNKPSEPSEP